MLATEHRRTHDCSEHHLPEVSARVCLEDPLWKPSQVSWATWLSHITFYLVLPCYGRILILPVAEAFIWGVYAAVMLERRASGRFCVVVFVGFLAAFQKKKNPHPSPCVVYPVLSLGVSKGIFVFEKLSCGFHAVFLLFLSAGRAGGLSSCSLVTMFVLVCMQDQHQ